MTINCNLVKKAVAQPKELRHSFYPKADDCTEFILFSNAARLNVRDGSFSGNKTKGSDRE